VYLNSKPLAVKDLNAVDAYCSAGKNLLSIKLPKKNLY
jgi:hypothetical protein